MESEIIGAGDAPPVEKQHAEWLLEPSQKILIEHGITITAYTSQVGNIIGETIDLNTIESNPVRAADAKKPLK